MRHFADVNAVFTESFGGASGLHPPARATVQVRLGGARLMLDAVALVGGAAAAAAGRFEVRTSLNVGSRSLWAPQCIGPYCQANVLRRQVGESRGALNAVDALEMRWPRMTKQSLRSGACLNDHYHQELRQGVRRCHCNGAWSRAFSPAAPCFPLHSVLCSGQIGLEPATMQLVRGGPRAQLRKSLRSTARVLAACGSALPLCFSVVLYVAEAALRTPGGDLAGLAELAAVWSSGRQLGGAPARAKARRRAAASTASSNEGGSDSDGDERALGGAVDNANEAEEDSELEAERMVPLGSAAYPAPRLGGAAAGPPVLLLVVPALPRGALVEVEVMAASSTAAAEGGGLRTICSAGGDELLSTRAASTSVAGSAWSCTAVAWIREDLGEAKLDELVGALTAQVERCASAAASAGSASGQLRVRAFVTHDLWPYAAVIRRRLAAALSTATAGDAVSVVPITQLTYGQCTTDVRGMALIVSLY